MTDVAAGDHGYDAAPQWLAFNAVGVMGAGVQLLVLFLLTDQLGWPILLSTGLAVEAAILHNFVWHERWTWRDRHPVSPNRLALLVRFNVVSATSSMTANIVLTGMCVKMLTIHPIPANLAATVSCSVLSFLAHDRFVFRATSEPSISPTPSTPASGPTRSRSSLSEE